MILSKLSDVRQFGPRLSGTSGSCCPLVLDGDLRDWHSCSGCCCRTINVLGYNAIIRYRLSSSSDWITPVLLPCRRISDVRLFLPGTNVSAWLTRLSAASAWPRGTSFLLESSQLSLITEPESVHRAGVELLLSFNSAWKRGRTRTNADKFSETRFSVRSVLFLSLFRFARGSAWSRINIIYMKENSDYLLLFY